MGVSVGNSFGILSPSKPRKPHKCDLPNLNSIWRKLFPYPIGTVFRCECGKVYKFSKLINDWLPGTLQDWLVLGGAEKYRG